LSKRASASGNLAIYEHLFLNYPVLKTMFSNLLTVVQWYQIPERPAISHSRRFASAIAL